MVKTKSTMLTFLLSLLLAFHVVATPAHAEATTVATDSFSVNVEALLADYARNDRARGIHAGIAVYNLTTDKPVYLHNEAKTYIPASNMKLFTTATALDVLGPSYQYQTEVYVNGEVTPAGVVKGDLILKGYGDPTLTEEDMLKLIEALKEKGVKEVTGALLVDESYFDQVRLGEGWMWDDEPYGYSAQISALALHKNSITITVSPDSGAAKGLQVELNPKTNAVSVDNQVKVVQGEDDDLSITRPRGKNLIVLTGTLGTEAGAVEEDVTMEDPALYVGDVWKRLLMENGIMLNPTSTLTKTQVTAGVPIATHHSKPLEEIIYELNKDSDNFYAEMLLKTLGAVKKQEGSFAAGAEVVADYLKRAGIETSYRQVDGSGLSRMDLITAEQMVKLLAFIQEQEYRDVLERSLPIAGVDGTLARRMKGTLAEGKLIAKTGSMSGVNGLSGYVQAENGDKLAFTILLNGVYKSADARAFQDKVGVMMADYPEMEASVFTPPATETYPLSSLIDPILDQENLKGVTAGVIVKSLERTSEEALLYRRDADKLLTPASNQKLLTSAVALQVLGSDRRFKTEVYLEKAQRPSGVVQGNVILKGYGDPTLHTEDALKAQEGVSVEEIAATLKKQGIKQIQGNIVVDESYFDSERLGLGWAWDDESYYYNAQLSALAINRGTVMIDYHAADQIGKQVAFTLVPNTKYVKVINEAKTVAKGEENTFTIERERGTNIIHLKGNLPVGEDDYERVPVEDPALYTGTVLKEKLEQAGIKVSSRMKVEYGDVPQRSVKVGEWYSEPLRDIVTYLNKKSDNFYAEMLAKQIGVTVDGEGSTGAGTSVITSHLGKWGLNTTFDMFDGSGLTRYNQIAASHIEGVLEQMTKQAEFAAYYESLPIAGVDGTLRSRMKGTPAANNVRAKTGTLRGVSSLSGYVTTKDGEKLVFSIVLNGYTEESNMLTAAQDQVAVALASYHKQ